MVAHVTMRAIVQCSRPVLYSLAVTIIGAPLAARQASPVTAAD
jgi:hypothetical protein